MKHGVYKEVQILAHFRATALQWLARADQGCQMGSIYSATGNQSHW